MIPASHSHHKWIGQDACKRLVTNIAVFAILSLPLISGTGLQAATPAPLEEAAKNGDADAMFEIGSLALIEQDYPEAFRWLKAGAQLKHGPSQAGLGFLYFHGFGCEADIDKARKLYEASAANGAHQGLNNLAHLYRYGLGGLEKDLEKTVELLSQAAELGNEYAANTLSKLYSGDEMGEPDLARTIHWLEFGAERNYPGCLSDLGFAYQHGLGVEPNTKKAIELFQKAMAKGSTDAMANLGYLYLMGEGVDQDYPKALELLEDAAKENNIGGLINLAVMRFSGLGCDPDPQTAFTLLETAQKLGSEQAGQLLKEWQTLEESQDQ